MPYALRGLLFCAACGRRMGRRSWPGKQTTRILYRCELGKSRSVPMDLTDHPRTVYLREDAVTPRLDEWIASLADPEDLARDRKWTRRAPGNAALLRQLGEGEQQGCHLGCRGGVRCGRLRTSRTRCVAVAPSATS